MHVYAYTNVYMYVYAHVFVNVSAFVLFVFLCIFYLCRPVYRYTTCAGFGTRAQNRDISHVHVRERLYYYLSYYRPNLKLVLHTFILCS